MVKARLIALRTLNYLRATHLPSYVALRALLESTLPGRFSATIDAVVSQATIRKHARILQLKRFKSFDGDGFSYRDYSIPAPSGALADSFALAILHEVGVLQRHSDVFSYRPPPESDYARNYEHFSVGYRERNQAVASALRNPGTVAVIADLRSFYPSISGERALRVLQERISASSGVSRRDAAVIQASAKRAVVVSDSGVLLGLRVGTEISHALANLYLSEVDARIRERFAGSYFRYVDDIVLVVERARSAEANAFLDKVFDEAGLRRNLNKDAIADVDEWNQYSSVGRRALTGTGDCLASLKFRLKLFLARHPDQLPVVKASLETSGVFLPLEQLLHGTADRVWRDRVAEFLRRGWRVLLKYRFDTLSDIVESAVRCRTEVLALLEQVLELGVLGDSGTVARRWQVQSVRFATNRALYFADASILERIVRLSETVPELTETWSVCEALRGDFRKLVQTSGPAVAACTQLMALRGMPLPKNVEDLALSVGDTEITADLEAHLALRGYGFFDRTVDDGNADLIGLKVFSRGSTTVGENAQLGYGVEMNSLALNFSPSRLREIARTRFMSREDIVFDALSLSSAYES